MNMKPVCVCVATMLQKIKNKVSLANFCILFNK